MLSTVKCIFFTAFLFLAEVTALSQSPELVVQTGHSDRVQALAFSPDGRLLASGSDDLSIKLWEVTTGKELKALVGHLGSVLSVTFSPDGKTLASTARGEEVIKFWNVATGAEVRTITGVTGNVYQIHFSPDGKSLVSGSYDGSIKLWDVTTGKALKTFQREDEGGSVISVSFSPDGKFLAHAGTTDPIQIKLWDVITGEELATWEDNSDKCGSDAVKFELDGATLVGATSSGIKKWSVIAGKEVSTSSIEDQRCSGESAFSHNLQFLARTVVNDDEVIKLISVATGKELITLQVAEDGNSVESLVFSPDNRVLASGDRVGKITLWDVGSGKELRTLRGHALLVSEFAFSRDGKVIAAGDEAGKIELWNTTAGSSRPLEEPSGGIDVSGYRQLTSLAFSPDSNMLASADSHMTIRLWDVKNAKFVRALKSPAYAKGNVYDGFSVVFGPDARTLIALEFGNAADMIRIWDATTGKELRVLPFSGEAKGRPISISADATTLASASEKEITLWDLTTGEKLRTLTGHSDSITYLGFSPNGKMLASAGSDHTIRLWSVENGQESMTLVGHSKVVLFAAFSKDGKLLASSGLDQTVRVWNLEAGKELKRFTIASEFVGPVNFSSDGATLLGLTLSGKTFIWDVSSGSTLASFIALNERDWVAVTPDGRFDGSSEGMKLLHYVQDNRSIPLDSFFEQLFTPRLLQRVYAREALPATTARVDLSKRIKLPPQVRIASPKPGSTAESDSSQIVVEATDQGGGVEDIRLYQNGKLVSDDTRQLSRDSTTKSKTFDVTLMPGINTFRATAFNSDRTEATPDEIKIELKAVETSSNLYILAIGLNEYKNTRYNLNYGRADAQAFADAVEQRGRGIFKQINKRVIFDADATRANIEAAFNEIIKQARPQDAFVFYYAGHGVMSESDDKNPADFYLVPYEVLRIYGDNGSLTTNGIAARNLRELLKNVRAQKQLIILDACESGGAVETIAMRGASEEKAIMQLARSAGVAVLASAGQDQVATEFAKLGHGIFTYALLKGLSGEADGSPRDGKITIKELEAYINDQVPELTKLYRGKRQDPNSWTRGQDFPIAIR